MKCLRSISWRASVWLLLAAALSACSGSSSAVKADWMTDFNQAQQLAAKEGRPMLLEFTASDWSPPCQKMDKEVLDTEPFKDFADKYLVLFKADFTRNPPPSGVIAQQNQALLDKIASTTHEAITSYPTFILVDRHGGITQRLVGIQPGEQFLNQLVAVFGLPPRVQ